MSSDLQLLLILALLIGVSKLCGHLSLRYLKLPMVFGEIVGDPEARLKAIRRAAEYSSPTPEVDIDQMLREVEQGYQS